MALEPIPEPAEDRLERERRFHDDVFGSDGRRRASKFYAIERYQAQAYERLALEAGRGGRALEYGCGPGSLACSLARHGVDVTGIDISGVAIEQAREQAEREGVASLCEFHVMNAEKLQLPDASFDLVCGSAILHHLDLVRAYAEIARVLKPDGHAVFTEPLGHNRLINAYRDRTPGLRTEDEHPLLTEDLELATSYFARVEIEHFNLLTLAAVPLRRTRAFDRILGALHRVDRALFRLPLKRYAWMVVISLEGPRLARPESA